MKTAYLTKQEIKINSLVGWSQLIENVLKTVAHFNADNSNNVTPFILKQYVENYNRYIPKGIFDYSAELNGDTLLILADGLLMLSLTMCEIHELVETNQNY